MFTLKCRSVDVTKKPTVVAKESKSMLLGCKDIELLDSVSLEPFEKDHYMFLIKKR